MPLIKRRFHIPCREDECLKLYELLKERLPPVSYVSIELTNKGLLVEAYGYESDVKQLWIEAKKLIGPLKEVWGKSGLKKYEVDLLARIARKTLPPRVLVEVLRKMLYVAEYDDNSNAITTNAPRDEVLKLAEKVAELNTIVGKYAANTSTRYFIIAGSVLSGLDPEEVVRISMSLGLLRQHENDEESEKKELTVNWKEALENFLKNVKKQVE